MPTFTSIDFELANPHHASICSIGFVKVVAGQVVKVRHELVRPPAPLDFVAAFNAELTGISASDLAGARGFDHWGPRLLRSLSGTVVVGHNVCAADLSMAEQSWMAHDLGPFPTLTFVDTVVVAKSVLPQASSRRLNHLVGEVLGEDLTGHHRADVDAEATARLLLALLETSGTRLADWARVRPGRAHRVLRPPHRRLDDTPIPDRVPA